MDGIEPVLFRLPEATAAVAAGRTIYIAEGEKAALALVAGLGLDATICPGGANKWRDSYSATLAGADVVILPNNDAPGERHAADVARKLVGIARSVRIVRLPSLPEKGDAWDWVYAGGTAEHLRALSRTRRKKPRRKPMTRKQTKHQRAPSVSWKNRTAERPRALPTSSRD